MPTKPSEFQMTVTSTAIPEALTSGQTLFHVVTIIGKKAARTNNVGTVYLGITSGNDTQSFPISPGETVQLTAPSKGGSYDFRDWFLDVDNNGDGVYAIFQ